MSNLDFDLSPKTSFVHGFVKGMIAPVGLFDSQRQRQPFVSVAPVVYQAQSTSDAIRRDWMVVGHAINKAVYEYQNQTNHSNK